MILTLHHLNSLLHSAALNVCGISLLAVTLCVVVPFFLIVVTLGTASIGAYALGCRWNGR
jgi:lipopolysaccharide export LptBFGC system permease protein LptF